MNLKILSGMLLLLIAGTISAQSPIALLEPANGAKGVGLFPVFRWTWEPGTTPYHEFQISTKDDFSVAGTHGGALANPHKLQCTLLPSTQYFWRVRIRDSQGGGNWSNAFNFTTRDTVINLIPRLKWPLDNSEHNVNNPVNFRWTKTAVAQTVIQISKDSAMQHPVYFFYLFAFAYDTSYTYTPKLELNTTYYWSITPVCPSGPRSEVFSFKVVGSGTVPPSVPPSVPPPAPPPPSQPAVRLTTPASMTGEAFSYPNPFKNSVTITFELTSPGLLDFEISDSQGLTIDRFNRAFYEKGIQSVEWRPGSPRPGQYFCKIISREKNEIIKLIITQ